jgi:hypothetical protein
MDSIEKGRQIMNLTDASTTQISIVVAVAVIVVVGVLTWFFSRKRRTERLRAQFGSAEYARAVKEGGSQRQAAAVLDERADRVENLHIQELAQSDRTRFVDSWAKVQARFVDSPDGAVTDADQLLGDVMSTRGYPVGGFEQRAADISVDHPLVLENYRAAHGSAVLQTQGKASTEDLRQAMIHYRTLFEELVREPEMARAKGA